MKDRNQPVTLEKLEQVLERHTETIEKTVRDEVKGLHKDIGRLDGKIDSVETRLSQKIDDLDSKLTSVLPDQERRIIQLEEELAT